MQQGRKNLIYENCEVFSPKGELMFRCLKKRANWYLKRELAKKLKDDPLSIQLTFTPKGKGEIKENLKNIKKNHCVVCGEKDLEKLTKHHIIPKEYRKHFPESKKNHNSIFIVSICETCHKTYENKHAKLLKIKISKKYNAPFLNESKDKVASIINTLLNCQNNIPEKNIKNIEEKLKILLKEYKISTVDIKNKEKMKNLLKDLQEKQKQYKNHGYIVTQKLISSNKINSFQKMWMKHFTKSMSPKFLN